jgi:hypothetical protein
VNGGLKALRRDTLIEGVPAGTDPVGPQDVPLPGATVSFKAETCRGPPLEGVGAPGAAGSSQGA